MDIIEFNITGKRCDSCWKQAETASFVDEDYDTEYFYCMLCAHKGNLLPHGQWEDHMDALIARLNAEHS